MMIDTPILTILTAHTLSVCQCGILTMIDTTILAIFRDESFITSWGGGGYIQGRGVGIFFGDVLGGGGEKKMTYGQGGGVMYFVRYWRGIRCVPLVFLFIASHSFWGALPPRPPIDQFYNVILSEPLGRHWK